MDNYASVLHQMEQFGVAFRDRDLPLVIDAPKRRTCGKGGKWWYWLRSFRPDSGGCYIVGRFGSYKHSTSEKVEVDWKPLGEAERARLDAERQAAQARADQARREESELAALGAADLWRRASPEGRSPYLERKGVVGESCRYLGDTLVVPLLRYDLPRDQALRAVQRIWPDGRKRFTKGFAKMGCCVRLGAVDGAMLNLLLVCEGYATGLTLRMATDHTLPVFVALDAGNLAHVVPLLRDLHTDHRILVCADDDWKTRYQMTGQLCNPGRTAARAVAKQVSSCDMLWPVFDPATRQEKDTDFNDLHARQGLDAVRRQLGVVLDAMRRVHG
ncbi:MAG: toprim domain-containing protein [Hydrogenophaga sp.]|uniref:toprim domain-containing protein n=1 Tax=Hydrogenophaga sp. TaxID=1904254 RepID=UPI00273469A8|nr:toprim domain-containing protein [Hydrogenophaga sp.]MDP3625030.1 toprim domain-containing protein [Hydrogenophaga sp.]